jgi:predicted RNase H-like HicB family nuclease
MTRPGSAYQVLVYREDDAWLGEVPTVAGTHTWAKNLPGLERNVREAIALALDLPAGAEGSVDLTWVYRTGDQSLDVAATDVRAARADLAEREAQVGARTGALTRALVGRGYSVRDVARLVGIAPQRASQIAPRAASVGPAVPHSGSAPR